MLLSLLLYQIMRLGTFVVPSEQINFTSIYIYVHSADATNRPLDEKDMLS